MAQAACHNLCVLRERCARMVQNKCGTRQQVTTKATIQRQHWISRATLSVSQQHGSVAGLLKTIADSMAGALVVQRARWRAFAKLWQLCRTRVLQAACCHPCARARRALSRRQRAGRTTQRCAMLHGRRKLFSSGRIFIPRHVRTKNLGPRGVSAQLCNRRQPTEAGSESGSASRSRCDAQMVTGAKGMRNSARRRKVDRSGAGAAWLRWLSSFSILFCWSSRPLSQLRERGQPYPTKKERKPPIAKHHHRTVFSLLGRIVEFTPLPWCWRWTTCFSDSSPLFSFSCISVFFITTPGFLSLGLFILNTEDALAVLMAKM